MYLSVYNFYGSYYVSFSFYSWKLRRFLNIGGNWGSKTLSTLPNFTELAKDTTEFRPGKSSSLGPPRSHYHILTWELPGPRWSKKQKVWLRLFLGHSPLADGLEWVIKAMSLWFLLERLAITLTVLSQMHRALGLVQVAPLNFLFFCAFSDFIDLGCLIVNTGTPHLMVKFLSCGSKQIGQ